jgi:hypothetical protein
MVTTSDRKTFVYRLASINSVASVQKCSTLRNGDSITLVSPYFLWEYSNPED